MYKGCTRDTQGTNRLAIPEHPRSNTLATSGQTECRQGGAVLSAGLPMRDGKPGGLSLWPWR